MGKGLPRDSEGDRMSEIQTRLRQNADSGDSCKGVSEDMREAANRIDDLISKLNWIGWSSDGIADAKAKIDRLTTELATVTNKHVKLISAASALTGYAKTCQRLNMPKWLDRLDEYIAAVETITSGPPEDTSVRALCKKHGIDLDRIDDQQDAIDLETGKRTVNE